MIKKQGIDIQNRRIENFEREVKMKLYGFWGCMSSPWDMGHENYIVVSENGKAYLNDGCGEGWDEFSSIEELEKLVKKNLRHDIKFTEINYIPKQNAEELKKEFNLDIPAIKCRVCGQEQEIIGNVCQECHNESLKQEEAENKHLRDKLEILLRERVNEWEKWREEIREIILKLQKPGYEQIGGDFCPDCDKRVHSKLLGTRVHDYSCDCGWKYGYWVESGKNLQYETSSPDEKGVRIRGKVEPDKIHSKGGQPPKKIPHKINTAQKMKGEDWTNYLPLPSVLSIANIETMTMDKIKTIIQILEKAETPKIPYFNDASMIFKWANGVINSQISIE